MHHKIHQPLVLAFIHNRNNFIAFFHIVGADGLINGRAAVELMKNKFSQLLLFFRDNTYPPLQILSDRKSASRERV